MGSRERRLDAAAARLDALAAGTAPNGWALMVRGMVAGERGEPAAGQLALYLRAADQLAAAGEARGEVIARTNAGRLLMDTGDSAGLRAQVDRALAAAARGTDAEAALRASVFEAGMLVAQGRELGRAHRALHRAHAAVFPAGSRGLQLMVLRHLGSLEVQLGHYDEGIAFLEQQLDLRRRAGMLAAVPSLRFSITNARQAQREERPVAGALDEVRALAGETVREARAFGDRAMEARAEALLAELWRGDDPAAATQHLLRSESVARPLGASTARARALIARATLLAARRPREAERALDAATALALSKGDTWTAYAAQVRLRLAWSMLPPREAAGESFRMLDLLERLRTAQADPEARMGLLSLWNRDYYWLAGRLLKADPSDVERTFEVSERLQARVLREGLEAQGMAAPAAVPPDLVRVRAAISAVQRTLLDPRLPPPRRAAALDLLRARELEEADLEASQAGAAAPIATRAIALAEARARLADDEALLVYMVGLERDLYGAPGGGSRVFVVTREAVRVNPIPGRLELEAAVPMFRGMIEARDGGEGAAAEALYRQLVGTALEGLGPALRRVTIVPDGVLNALPFAALRGGPDVLPLGARYALDIAPSVTLWARWRELPARPAGRAALVLAAPLLPGSAVEAERERGQVLAAGLALGPLPHAEREGRGIRRALGRGSEVLSGAQATEAALKARELGPFALLHFATHAVADDAFPERSAVLLAAGAEGEDGLLQPREVARLDLRGKAVVLSACQTADGPLVAGEGVMSLSRSFLAAGARTVVAGLWRLRDDETERLMRRLYEGLAEGRPLGESLQRARARAVREGLPAAAWAGVVVLGDQDFALPPAGPSPWRAAILLPALAAAAVAWLAFRGRGRRAGPAPTRDGG